MSNEPEHVSSLIHHNPAGLHRSPAFSQAVEVEPGTRLVFIGGQNGTDTSGSIVGDTLEAQTTQALRNVQTVVEAAGGSLADIAKWTILATENADIDSGFSAFQAFWDPSIPPPAITVQIVAGLASPDFLVEIEAVAAIPDRSSPRV
jgi:enamine deaminase RidA (YjgF/YER057c/UK114 family)